MISVINITSSFYLQIQAFIKLIIFGWFKFFSIKISCVILFLSPYFSLNEIKKIYEHEFKGILEAIYRKKIFFVNVFMLK